jgi:TonB-linked SusC/RagA family outer membrane protein
MIFFTNSAFTRAKLYSPGSKGLTDYLNLRKIMRIGMMTLIMLTSSIQLFSTTPARSQSVGTVEVKLELRNESLISAFKKIERQSSFHFMYSPEDVKNFTTPNLPSSTRSVAAILDDLLENTNLAYKQKDQKILIMNREDIDNDNQAADINVKGQVTDATGETLPGVSIKLKNSTAGTSTDIDGNYSIRVPEGSVLVFTYIGYVTQEITVTNQTTLNVVLNASSSALSEVVVTALGISREAKSLAYSAQTVKSEEITKATGTNVVNALQGKVAGLTITRSTSGVGGGSNVLLRGNRSITGNNAPLYITDGVPGGIGLEDGDNIESISVLKGAAAAALYGSAGQNGVIIITTKKGKSGQTNVEFNGGVLFDRADVHSELQTEYGQGDGNVYVASSEHSWGPKIAGQNVTLWNGNTVAMQGYGNNLQDFFRTGATWNNSLSITTGSEKMQTYFSYGNVTAQGIIRNNDLSRHNVNLRINNQVSKKLSFDTKLTYNTETINNNPASFTITSIYRTPVSIPMSEMEQYLYTDASGNARQNYWKPGSSIIGNPFFYMNRNLSSSNVHRIVGLLSTKYDFNDWMSLQLRGNVNQTFSGDDQKIYSDSYHSLIGSNYILNNGRSTQSNIDGLLTFKRDVSSSLNLSGHLGGAIQGTRNENVNNNANGLNKADFFFLGNGRAPIVTNSLAKSPLVQSLYASATLAYKDFLYLDMTGRNDWSSALPKGEESIFYPSIGLTGIISDMVQLPSWISYGKVRASVAQSGFGGNAYLGREYYTVVNGGGIATPTIKAPGNYKPELTNSFEAGADWRFFNSRLGFDVTYYRTRTENQLLLIGAPTATLFNQKYINAGLIQNNGVEVVMSVTPVKAGNFSWDASVNFTKNVNKVVELTPEMKSVIIQDDGISTIRVEEGKAYGTMYVKGWQRDAQGRKLVDDLGRPLLTSAKDVYAGNFNPDFMIGMNNSLKYKNVSFSFQIDYRNGGNIIGGTQPLMDADGHSVRSLQGRETGIVIDGYTKAGVQNTKSITSQQYFSSIGDRYPTGEEYNYSATNMRLREMSLDFVVPTQILGKAKYIKSARVSLVGRNLFFLDKDAPFDPDIARGRGGTEYTALPFTKTFGLNLRASF